ncbi:hypothetical protein CWI38_0235p0010 [Hamiltosporidium tvaerminnensis]|uniref:Uncharacterized protein n=1 Tax=Hamiltosporidium tvaerminnensis TaxID=1176355 RepID=A0A4Q9LZ83_9MICR|nr:hypothetical protein CWI38_0235p0010 [Hamiltosporidium tvaerminnensis]
MPEEIAGEIVEATEENMSLKTIKNRDYRKEIRAKRGLKAPNGVYEKCNLATMCRKGTFLVFNE